VTGQSFIILRFVSRFYSAIVNKTNLHKLFS